MAISFTFIPHIAGYCHDVPINMLAVQFGPAHTTLMQYFIGYKCLIVTFCLLAIIFMLFVTYIFERLCFCFFSEMDLYTQHKRFFLVV